MWMTTDYLLPRILVLMELLKFQLICRFLLPCKDIAEEVERICKVMGAGVDVSFDCVGVNKTTSTALIATRAGGKACDGDPLARDVRDAKDPLVIQGDLITRA